jgi:type IV pilus assembly protein PilM
MRPGIRSRPWAGIDIGSYSVKLVATLGTRHWVAEVPNTVPEHERETPAGRQSLARLVADCISRTGLSTRGFRGITLGISGPDVILKQISLPYMDEAEVGPALRFEARKHLPFDPQGMVIDFQIVGRSITEKRMDILLAAVSQERLDRLVAPLRLLDLDADIIDATPLALTNALFHQVALTAQTQMLLDLGHSASHLILHQRSEPYFARRFEFGGRSITQAVARGMKIPFEEAEAWKISLADGTPSFAINWSLPEMNFILDTLRFDLIEELKRSVAFYRTIGKLSEPFTLWLSGGAARLPGLPQRLEELLEAPVQVFNPMKSVNDDRRDGASKSPQFAQALGLALRTA